MIQINRKKKSMPDFFFAIYEKCMGFFFCQGTGLMVHVVATVVASLAFFSCCFQSDRQVQFLV